MTLIKSLVLLTSLSTVGFVAGNQADACPKSKKTASIASVTVEDAATLHKQGKIIMVDANGADTRKKVGVVPGARLLSSYNKFAASELKASKSDTLVFYCYNKQCGAAPGAAEVARKLGYKTKVMHAGIMGWKKAGNKVSKVGGPNS